MNASALNSIYTFNASSSARVATAETLIPLSFARSLRYSGTVVQVTILDVL